MGAQPSPRQIAAQPDGNGEAGTTDAQLIDLAKTGDMSAYAEFFNRHADRIRRMAYLILHNPSSADDVVQETFTRGLVHLATYRGDTEPRSWFSSIALNLCRHAIRDKGKEAELTDTEKLEGGVRIARPRTRGVMSSAIRREGNRELKLAMGYLTEAQREVVVLHYVDDLPYEEVGRILEIRPGAARALAHRAKAVLHKRLGARLEFLQKP
jgi:RNA polymerase sigma-70 factor (ECF subfamily)